MTGYAVRLGFEVPIPQLVTVGGQTAVQTDRRAGQGTIAGIGGLPVFFAYWEIDYDLPGSPTDIGVPPNPYLGTEGTL